MRGSWDDRNAFVSWVDEHAGFDDAMVRRIEPVPGEGGAPPDTVALEIARQVDGGLHAGDTRRLSRFLLRCHGVSRFGFEGAADHCADCWSQGFENGRARSGSRPSRQAHRLERLLRSNAMTKRLRKKKRVGEFKERGFELLGYLRAGISNDDIDAFVDRPIVVVEARKLGFGRTRRGARRSAARRWV